MKDFPQNLVVLEASPLGQFFNFQRTDQCQVRFLKTTYQVNWQNQVVAYSELNFNSIGLIMVLEAILTSRQPHEKITVSVCMRIYCRIISVKCLF